VQASGGSDLPRSGVRRQRHANWQIKYHAIQMTMRETWSWLCIAIAACALGAPVGAQARGEFCGSVPAPGFDQPPNSAHSGRYLNQVYGYAVTIPPKLTGYTSAVGAQRGFGIVLSWMPRAYLSVDAAYDAFYDITADGVHRRDLNAIRLHDQLVDDRTMGFALAHAAGGRYRTRVQCGSDPQTYIHEDVIVVRNREIYRVNLQTLPERYEGDVKVLDALLRSWRWEAVAAAPYVK
jgi:hypothetical protein